MTPRGAASSGSPVVSVRSRHVALLRGVNVGRAKRIGMAELREAVTRAGFADVETLLASGNVVFDACGAMAADAAARIEAAIVRQFGITSRVQVVTADELAQVVAENPFPQAEREPSRVFVTFVEERALLMEAKRLGAQDWGDERLAVGTRAVYAWCPNGASGGTLMDGIGRVVRDRATTRNWGTTTKLLAKAMNP